jgi:hypothetical protein
MQEITEKFLDAQPQDGSWRHKPALRVNELRTFLIKSYFLIFGCVAIL